MIEKPKNIDNARQLRILRGCSGLVIFACLGICGLLYSLPFFLGELLRTQLDSAIIPTAEALLSNPSEIVVSDDIHLHLWVDERYVGGASDAPNDVVCISTYIDQENYQDYQDNSRL